MSYGNSKYIDAHPEHQVTNKMKQPTKATHKKPHNKPPKHFLQLS